MKERPILFSAPMVRAILEGRKTQTRRVIKNHIGDGSKENPLRLDKMRCPFGQVGDQLWVRESWCDTNYEGSPAISYQATQDSLDLMERDDFLEDDGSFNYEDQRLLFGKKKKPLQFAVWYHDLECGIVNGWKPSIYMPRWASRIQLEITGIRVERLREICERDACLEGAPTIITDGSHVKWFEKLWSSINGRESWDANPWVWVVEFQRVKP